MKNLIPLITGFLVFLCVNIAPAAMAEEIPEKTKATVKLYCTPEMAELAENWAADYQQANDDIIIQLEIIKSGEKQMPDLNETEIALITDRETGSLSAGSHLKFVIGRDVVVPVVNSGNPLSALIRNCGLSPQQLSALLSGPDEKNWGILDESGKSYPLNCYMPAQEDVRFAVAEFLALPLTDLTNSQILASPEFVRDIKNDKFGLGWCLLSDVTDPETGALMEGITLLPIDRDGNGKIDHFENIYAGVNDFNRGVWIGKYPRTLVTSIYSVVPDAGLDNAGAGFVKWMITDGQESLAALGHNPMLSIEKPGVLDKMTTSVKLAGEPDIVLSATSIVFLVLGGIALLVFIIALTFGRTGRKSQAPAGSPEADGAFINGNSLSLPGGLYFDKTHTWAFMEKEGRLRIGIDDFLQHVTGKFTRVMMKSPGAKVKKNEHLVTLIREGKQINLYSPVSGTIVSCNPAIPESPSLLNTSPYSDGWLYMIEPANWLREIGFLQMAEKHVVWLKSELERLKDFLAQRIQTGGSVQPGFALQEGGMLRDHALADLDPEVWEDFQKCFIDTPL